LPYKVENFSSGLTFLDSVLVIEEENLIGKEGELRKTYFKSFEI
jgi:hypothetical protein